MHQTSRPEFNLIFLLWISYIKVKNIHPQRGKPVFYDHKQQEGHRASRRVRVIGKVGLRVIAAIVHTYMAYINCQ